MRAQVGWLTAEYAMLPGSTPGSVSRSSLSGSRTKEIQRLIGRSLRTVVDLQAIEEATLRIDCDVIQPTEDSDRGDHRSVVAVTDAIAIGLEHGIIAADPITDHCAAVSVGMVGGVPTLDLVYDQDVAAEVDMNVVMTGSGGIVEVQGTAERAPFSRAQLDALLDLATSGITRLVAAQRRALGR
jgi:ribonuclease PH